MTSRREHTLRLRVRHHEMDAFGHVNNAVYLNYVEEAAVDHARENGLDLSIRGGGHSVPGFGTNDGGVVIDFSRMRGVRVDPAARTARAEGGATWGDFNAATHAFGLATTGGVAPYSFTTRA